MAKEWDWLHLLWWDGGEMEFAYGFVPPQTMCAYRNGLGLEARTSLGFAATRLWHWVMQCAIYVMLQHVSGQSFIPIQPWNLRRVSCKVRRCAYQTLWQTYGKHKVLALDFEFTKPSLTSSITLTYLLTRPSYHMQLLEIWLALWLKNLTTEMKQK